MGGRMLFLLNRGERERELNVYICKGIQSPAWMNRKAGPCATIAPSNGSRGILLTGTFPFEYETNLATECITNGYLFYSTSPLSWCERGGKIIIDSLSVWQINFSQFRISPSVQSRCSNGSVLKDGNNERSEYSWVIDSCIWQSRNLTTIIQSEYNLTISQSPSLRIKVKTILWAVEAKRFKRIWEKSEIKCQSGDFKLN